MRSRGLPGTPCCSAPRNHSSMLGRAYDDAFGDMPHMVCYAVKANSTLAVLSLLARAGAGFDIVSGGELYRVLKAGGDPARVIFSGAGKAAAEIHLALSSGIFNFNCESEAELAEIAVLPGNSGVVVAFLCAREPGCGCGDTPLHQYRSAGPQIWRGYQRGGDSLQEGARIATSGSRCWG